jgi:hypothetical protein
MRTIARLMEGRHSMLSYAFTLSFMVIALPCTWSFAQSGHAKVQSVNPAKVQSVNPAYTRANNEVALARSGNVSAMVDITHEMFLNAGIPSQAADAFNFTGRVVQAQQLYLQGDNSAVHESDIVSAVNRFTTTLGLPKWAQTNEREVRRLRVRLFLVMPQLFANHDATDPKAPRPLFSQNMSPMEAGYVATTLLFMKVVNPQYQFSTDERAHYSALGAHALVTEERGRLALMHQIVTGHSKLTSVVDILPAADQLFTDLGMPQANNWARGGQVPPVINATQKGEF